MNAWFAIFTSALLSIGLTSGALAQGPKAAPAEKPEVLAGHAKEIFRAHCFECHGGTKTNGGVKILDHDLLIKKEKIAPGKPDDSYLFQLISATDDSMMPPPGQPRLHTDEIEAIRKWIVAGAPIFPTDAAKPVEEKVDPALKDTAGVDYVLKKILAHVGTLKLEDRRFQRYFSINHLLLGGATADELDLHREALAKAINHLTWETGIVKPQAIDAPMNTVFAIDVRDLGWHRQPYDVVAKGHVLGKSKLNIFDLALLEYPYGIVYKDSETFDKLAEAFLYPADQVRPIPYVRADWFVSTVTQPPLYEDFLQLPFTLPELEHRLGVDAANNIKDGIAKRSGMTVSGVSRNNRVVERQKGKSVGSYWKSFDFKSNRGLENMFRNPIDFKESGGEMIFSLPNGLQGYYIANARGDRLDAAPTEIVVDKFSDDKIVRNGLACMRCHDAGMKGFTDTVRPALLKLPGIAGFDKRDALDLYPEQKVMDGYLKDDGDRFMASMNKVLGKPQTREPLIPVTRRYLENPLQLTGAAGELGLSDPTGLQMIFRSPQFSGLGLLPLASQGVIRRDAWEEYFDQAVLGLGIGAPVIPLDGVTRRDYPAGPAPYDVELKTNKRGGVVEPGDIIKILVVNKAGKPLYVELVATSARGKKIVLTAPNLVVPAGSTYTFPPEGEGLLVKGGLGKEQITLFSSDTAFPAGELLRGKEVSDRVVHSFYRLEMKGGRLRLVDEPIRMVKRTIDIETR